MQRTDRKQMCIRDRADKENSIHGLNLMLVEDNELNAEVAEILLEDEGAIITMAVSYTHLDVYKRQLIPYVKG